MHKQIEHILVKLSSCTNFIFKTWISPHLFFCQGDKTTIHMYNINNTFLPMSIVYLLYIIIM